MNKVNTICLSCGKVQVRTDIVENLNDKYVVLSKKIMCPRCNRETKQAATKNIKTLVKKLDPAKDKLLLRII